MKLTIATCQFPVDRDISINRHFVLSQMRSAHKRGARVVHFSECALSGYAGIEFKSFRGFHWKLLESATHAVMDEAKRLKVWVILGSSHRLTGRHKPHNSTYIIDDRGRLVDRYDKMFCTGDASERDGDLKHYSPGSHLCVFEIDGVRCGALICHDFRYQELYREYLKRGVRLMFHSYHNAHARAAVVRKHGNIWGAITPPTMQAYAANNAMWISANNSSRSLCLWPSFFVRPDGMVSGKLTSRPGVLVTALDTNAKFYDASGAWRGRAMEGVFHSGTLVKDKRSDARRAL